MRWRVGEEVGIGGGVWKVGGQISDRKDVGLGGVGVGYGGGEGYIGLSPREEQEQAPGLTSPLPDALPRREAPPLGMDYLPVPPALVWGRSRSNAHSPLFRTSALPPLDWPLPSQFDQYELRIEVQPRPHHRAHYETEGSRGAVKATPSGHPLVKLCGYSERKPLSLQVFVGTADDRSIRPHPFYQIHRVTGKMVGTASHESVQAGTKVLDIPLTAENNMTALIDCAGILKLRNSDIELRKGETDVGRKNTRVRLVFRTHLPLAPPVCPPGRLLALQVASVPIECSQRSAQELPVLESLSFSSSSAEGGDELLLRGTNFLPISRVVFMERGTDGKVHWEEEAHVDRDNSSEALLCARVPSYSDLSVARPVTVSLYVSNGKRKRSSAQAFKYLPSEYPPSEYPPSEYLPSEYPPSEYPPSEYPPSEYPPSEYLPSEYPPSEYLPSEYPPSEYLPSEYLPSEYLPSEYPPSEYPALEYLPSEYPPCDYLPSEYLPSEYLPSEYPPSEYLPSEYLPSEYPPSEYPPSEYLPSEYLPSEYLPSEYPPSEYPPSEYPPSEYLPSEYPPCDYLPSEYLPSEYLPSEYLPSEYLPSEYPPSEYLPSEYLPSEYPPSEYPPSEYPPSEYPPSEYPPSDEYPPSEYPPSEYPPSEYPPSEYPPSEYPPSEYPPSEYLPILFKESDSLLPRVATLPVDALHPAQAQLPAHEDRSLGFHFYPFSQPCPSALYPEDHPNHEALTDDSRAQRAALSERHPSFENLELGFTELLPPLCPGGPQPPSPSPWLDSPYLSSSPSPSHSSSLSPFPAGSPISTSPLPHLPCSPYSHFQSAYPHDACPSPPPLLSGSTGQYQDLCPVQYPALQYDGWETQGRQGGGREGKVLEGPLEFSSSMQHITFEEVTELIGDDLRSFSSQMEN
uniref:RHD domain-containing protein n=1 Tax=Knipowitschia caucasica TaxID=637954 RepID=A0AAV2JS37_KNICA